MDFGSLYENDKGEYVVLNDVRMADIRSSYKGMLWFSLILYFFPSFSWLLRHFHPKISMTEINQGIFVLCSNL